MLKHFFCVQLLINLTFLLHLKYDYFHNGGDGVYLSLENVRLCLESEDIQAASNGGHYLPTGSEDSQTPLFMGQWWQLV